MNPRSLALGALTLAAATLLAVPAHTLPAATPAPQLPATPLPLGPSDLPETRTSRTLQAGLTWTVIERGAINPDARWVVELNIPATATSPDPAGPARSVQDQASAEAFVARLAAQGFEAEAQPVLQTATVDVPEGVIGHRARLTSTYASKAEADAELARVRAAGFSGRSWYSGWDGDSDAAGRWSVHVLTVDPRTFTGELGGTFGPTLEARERTTWLAAHEGATAALNAGFFVFDPTAGAEGDPAGAAVYDGRLASETIGDRPVLVLDPAARHTRITRPLWSGTAALPSGTATLDGTNRVPGLVRNCGGLGDSPTTHPLHDFTCTDPGELVAFDTSWGATTPSGAGQEVVLDPHGRIVTISDARGTALSDGQRSLQATGDRVAELDGLHVGTRLPLSLRLHAADDSQLVRPGATVVNGGPQLLEDGVDHITQAGDGMVHPGNPSFQYGWVLQRNPRTFAGIDAAGRTVFVTVDGRQVGESGLSIQETADVARALGLVDAINLDGGGSTAMVVEGSLVSRPSDATGERPVGDAIYVR